MTSWQPMETAPKGGGAATTADPAWIEPPKILLAFAEGEHCIAYWDWYYADGQPGFFPRGNGYTDGCAWIEPHTGDPVNLHHGEPVAWMPIPAWEPTP